MSDKIEITREEFEAFRKNTTLECYICWDDFKKFIEKERAPKRRELSIHSTSFKEVLPGDIGPMTKNEAREWIRKGLEGCPIERLENSTGFLSSEGWKHLFKALGLTE